MTLTPRTVQNYLTGHGVKVHAALKRDDGGFFLMMDAQEADRAKHLLSQLHDVGDVSNVPIESENPCALTIAPRHTP